MNMIEFAIKKGIPSNLFDGIDDAQLLSNEWDSLDDYYKLVGLWQWASVFENSTLVDPKEGDLPKDIRKNKCTQIKFWAALKALEEFESYEVQGEELWAWIAADIKMGTSLCDIHKAVAQGYKLGVYGEKDDTKAARYEEKARGFADEALADMYFEGEITQKNYWAALVFYTRCYHAVSNKDRKTKINKRMAKCYLALGDYIMYECFRIADEE